MLGVGNQSLGQYLKAIREQRNLSIDEAARETNIAKRYIEALENDQYGFFPAEMYVTGFLSAYCEILELDRDAVLAMYTKAVSKEQEVPLEQLYEISNQDFSIPKNIGKYTIIFLMFLVIFYGVFVLFSSQKVEAGNEQALSSQTINLDNLDSTNSFTSSVRGKITLQRGKKKYNIEFLGIQDKKQIIFRLEKNRYTQKAGDILTADLSEDGINDISLEILDVNNQAVSFSFLPQNLSASINKTLDNTSGFDLTPYAGSILSETSLAPMGTNAGLTLKVKAEAAVWIQAQVDTKPSQEILLNPGDERQLPFLESLILLIGNSGAALLSFSELPEVQIRGGAIGESSYSLFYKKGEAGKKQIFRAQLK